MVGGKKKCIQKSHGWRPFGNPGHIYNIKLNAREIGSVAIN
jgi:hypothetical protein